MERLKTNAKLGGLIFVLLALLLAGAHTASAAAKSYILTGATVFPEAETLQESTGNLFVGSNSDGTIYMVNVNGGSDTASVFLPAGSDGRTSVNGLKVDSMGHLYVAGAMTGQIFIYDIASKSLLAKLSSGKNPTFVNDVALTPDGSAYFTDSQSPVLYRVSSNGGGYSIENWLDFTGTAFAYQTGFNANGIAASANGRYLIVVQSNTGKLFRIDTTSKSVSQISLGSDDVAAGDGIFLHGNTLWVARNAQGLIVTINMSSDFSSGQVVSTFTDASFAYPTAVLASGNTLFVVNSQFNKRGQTPSLPFTVSAVEQPGATTTPGMACPAPAPTPLAFTLWRWSC